MSTRVAELVDLLHREVKPALGCTEPIAVALAVTKAVEVLESNCPKDHMGSDWRMTADLQIEVAVSGNILKNGMGVGIPGTGMIGLYIAAALGAVCGKSTYGLEVLHDLEDRAIARAKEIVEAKKVSIGLAETDKKLYVEAKVRTGDCHCASAVIADLHDHIIKTCFDEQVMSEETNTETENPCLKPICEYGLTVKEIYDFTHTVDIEEIKFLLEERAINMKLAEEGLRGDYGLGVGKTLKKNKNGIYGEDFVNYATELTAAASDARMAGCTLPAMSNTGSGNQGIITSVPVIAYAQKYHIDDEKLARALAMSNLIAIHIKGYLGRLSAICGCVVASTGSSCGIVYLQDGTYEQICAAIKNMIGNITGMVCDGAKVGCALKVASGVTGAIQAAVLAMDGKCISENDGIIEKDVEKTIRNLANIGSVGMQKTDEMILKIMVCK